MKLSLFLLMVSCLILAGCSTPAETATAIGAVGAAAVSLIDVLKPVLSPEQLAKLHAVATHVDGTVASVQQGFSVLADVVAAIKSSTASNFEQVASAATTLSQKVAALPTQTDLLMHDAGVGSGAIGGARLLSAMKHGYIGKQKTA